MHYGAAVISAQGNARTLRLGTLMAQAIFSPGENGFGSSLYNVDSF